eukprot:gene660-2095_t
MFPTLDSLEPQRKAYLIQNIMVSRYIVAQQKRIRDDAATLGAHGPASDNTATMGPPDATTRTGESICCRPPRAWRAFWGGIRLVVAASAAHQIPQEAQQSLALNPLLLDKNRTPSSSAATLGAHGPACDNTATMGPPDAATRAGLNKQKRLKQAKEAETSTKEAETSTKRLKQAKEAETSTKRLKQAKEAETSTKRLKQAKEAETSTKRLKQAKEAETSSKRLKQAKEAETSTKRLKQAKEAETSTKRLKQAKEAETSTKRLKRAKEAETKTKRLKQAKEAETSTKRLKQAKEAEKSIKKLEQAQRGLNKQKRLRKA